MGQQEAQCGQAKEGGHLERCLLADLCSTMDTKAHIEQPISSRSFLHPRSWQEPQFHPREYRAAPGP